MWRITDFCFNLSQKYQKIINFTLVISIIVQFALGMLNIYIGPTFLLLYIPINVINFLNIRRTAKYGYKPILKMSEEEIILNELTGENDWDKISCGYFLTENFMLKYKEHLNWALVISNQKLRIKFLEKIWGYIDINKCIVFLILHQKLSKKFVMKHIDDFKKFSEDQPGSYIMLKEFFDFSL